MQLLLFGLVGISVGIVLAGLRVPKPRILPSIGAMILAGTAIVGLLQFGMASLGAGLLLVFCAALTSALYSGFLWQREGIDPSTTYWGWVGRDFTHPSYGRRLYEESKATQE